MALIAQLDFWLVEKSRRKDTSPLSSLSAILKPASERRLRILELGAGCGLVGIWLSSMLPQSKVLLTDLPEAMDVLRCNVKNAKPANDSKLEIGVLDWDTGVATRGRELEFDLIVISDCTYNCDSVPALVSTVAALVHLSPHAVILVSMKVRHDSEAIFFDLMSEHGLSKLEQHSVPFMDRPDAPLGDAAEVVDVYLFGSLDMERQAIE